MVNTRAEQQHDGAGGAPGKRYSPSRAEQVLRAASVPELPMTEALESMPTCPPAKIRSAGRTVWWLMFLLIPASLVAEGLHLNALLVFMLSGLGIVPLAATIARATESLAGRVGPAMGGLLNASFGNATEMIVSVVALSSGLVDVVKASISGTIITNSLLAVGLAMILGGVKRKEQRFRPAIARLNAISLNLALVVLLVPTGLQLTTAGLHDSAMSRFSLVASVLLLAFYLLTLLFSMRTHRHLFELNEDSGVDGADPESEGAVTVLPPLGRALAILLLSSAVLVLESEVLVSSLKTSIADLGLPKLFTGVILIPIFGGAVEYIVTANFALKNKMDLALAVAMGSSLQIAMFVAPILVLVGQFMGQPMNLAFQPFEVLAVGVAVLIANSLSTSGRSNWLEGALLLVTYGVLAAGFYFHP